MTSAAARVDALAPGSRELAMLASLARRVEPQLLRALRLELAPERRAADEADLWFSPIVETAAATGLVFDPEVLPVLQRRLAEDPLRRLDATWHLMFRLRARVPFEERDRAPFSTWLLVHEELTWWAVRGGPSNAQDAARIDMLFGWVQHSLTDEGTSSDAAIWIRSAESLIPRQVWALPGAARLKAAAGSLNRARAFWVRRVEDGIEMSERALDEAHRIDTSTPQGAIRVDVVPRGDATAQAHTVLVDGRVSFVPSAARCVDLHLSDGQVLALDVEEPDLPPADRRARLRSVVVLLAGQACWTGLLLSPRHALTFAHAAERDKVTVLLPDAFEWRGASPSGAIAGEMIARVPAGTPHSFPEDLAIVRLERAVEGAGVGNVPVVGAAEAIVGRTVNIDIATAPRALSQRPQSLRVNGVVSGLTDRGYTIRLEPVFDRSIFAQAGGAPVWLESGELLGVLIRTHDTFDEGVSAVVAPMPPIQSVLRGIRRRVLVAGTGQRDLPEEVWRIGQSLGRALADAGYFLVCGGWPGVDYLVAQSFTESLGSHAPLESRVVQLVEEGWSPDLKLPVPPVTIDPNLWARQMVAWADAVVALGGVGGVRALCEVAIDAGCPVLPVPGTGADARAFHASLMSGDRRQAFPDRRALRFLESGTGTQEAAERMTERIVALLQDCFDDVRIAQYRESAAALHGLFATTSIDRSALPVDTFMRELAEAAAGTPLPSGEADALAKLRAVLPAAARWLIADLVRLDTLAASEGMQRVRNALLDAILADESASEQLSQAIFDDATGAKSLDRLRSVWLRRSGDHADEVRAQAIERFLERLETAERSRRALSALFALAREFLGPVDMKTFGEAYRKLQFLVAKAMPRIDDDVGLKLVASRDAARRVVGYTIFWLRPEAALLPTLTEALEVERTTAFTTRETRPLWLFLTCLSTALHETTLAHQLPPELDAQLDDLLRALEASKDVDPGRECTGLLRQIIETLRLSRTTESFATYSRRISGPKDRARYAWCVFIDAPRARLDAIAEVEYQLNSSFDQPIRRSADAALCFALLSESWRGFKIKIRITYKSGRQTDQTYPLELKPDAWPLGPAFSGQRDEPSTRVYAVLVDFRWNWRTESALRRETGLAQAELRAVLNGLVRASHVRESPFRSEKGEVMWGATTRVGLLPVPGAAAPSSRDSPAS